MFALVLLYLLIVCSDIALLFACVPLLGSWLGESCVLLCFSFAVCLVCRLWVQGESCSATCDFLLCTAHAEDERCSDYGFGFFLQLVLILCCLGFVLWVV